MIVNLVVDLHDGCMGCPLMRSHEQPAGEWSYLCSADTAVEVSSGTSAPPDCPLRTDPVVVTASTCGAKHGPTGRTCERTPGHGRDHAVGRLATGDLLTWSGEP